MDVEQIPSKSNKMEKGTTKSSKQKVTPSVAPGMRDYLELEATEAEKQAGNYTKVTTLSFDETH